MSSRSFKSASTDIEARLVLGMAISDKRIMYSPGKLGIEGKRVRRHAAEGSSQSPRRRESPCVGDQRR